MKKHLVEISFRCGLLTAICSATASSAPADIASTHFETSLVAKSFVLQEKDWHIWCNAPELYDEGKVHLFVSRWPVKDGFGLGWHTSCEIAHYFADKLEGPYTYVETVLKGDGKENSWCAEGTHNGTVVRLADKRYAPLFTANSGSGRGEDGFPANQKIGLMHEDRINGPWKFAEQDGLILDRPAGPEVWSHARGWGSTTSPCRPCPTDGASSTTKP